MDRRKYLEDHGWKVRTCSSQTNPGPVYVAQKGPYTFTGDSITDLYNKVMCNKR